jgi:hypothetical protein
MAFIVAALVVIPAGAIGPCPARSSGAALAPSGLRPMASACPGAGADPEYHGQLANQGGPSPGPTVAGQLVDLTYWFEGDHTLPNGSIVRSCPSTGSSARTNSTGVFDILLPVPSDAGSWNYSGPYGPLAWSLADLGTMRGDYLGVHALGSLVTLDRVAALDRVVLSPAGSVTVSGSAPVNVSATALAGDGHASPASVGFAWQVSSPIWTVEGRADAAVLRLVAPLVSNSTRVALWANGTYNGTPVAAPLAVLWLTGVPTRLTELSEAPADADVGSPTMFGLQGTGAPGYAYAASVSPGLGMAPVDAFCLVDNGTPGLLRLSCHADVTFESTGTAYPSVELTNGYSGAVAGLLPIPVAAPLRAVLSPDPAVTYPGVPVRFTGTVAPGTGSPPYGPACLADGAGARSCRGPGTSWNFSETYNGSGTFEAAFTVGDSAGGTDTDLVPVTVAPRPSIGSVQLAADTVLAGRDVVGSDTVAGGAMPLAYWWNLSTESTPLSMGTMARDGTIGLGAVASTAGPASVTLTVVDALGTRVDASAYVSVLPDTVAAVSLVGATVATVAAGSPLLLSFEALDGLGGLDFGYAGPVDVWVNGSAAASAWVNGSGGGPLPVGPEGSRNASGADWDFGWLNLTVSDPRTGELDVRVEPGGGALGSRKAVVTVVPDLRHLVLSDPRYVAPGARANATVYGIADRFGNPLAGGAIVVRCVFAGTSTSSNSTILAGEGGSTVWVNYTATGSGAGTVYVLGPTGEPLLAPIAVPAAPAGPGPASYGPWAGLAAVAALAAALIAAVLAIRSRRRPRAAPAPPSTSLPTESAGPPASEEGAAVEEELKRLAEGRAHVLLRTPTDREVGLEEIAEGWTGRPPDLAELSEWVGALVQEGLLCASVGPDGAPVFRRTELAGRAMPPRVEVDERVLQAALERLGAEGRDEAGRDGPGPEGPDGGPGPGGAG